jgi:septation ring formation regulator EzrA
MSVADELRKLQELRHAGVLNEEEFAKAKASILSSLPSPSTMQQELDQKNARIHQQLKEFQTRFAQSHADTARSHLDKAEDLLITVCGPERYRSFIESAKWIAQMHAELRDLKQSRLYDEARPLGRKIEEEFESLKKRIAGIEHRV